MSAVEIERTVKLSRATDLGAGETADHVIVRRPTVGEVNAFLDVLRHPLSRVRLEPRRHRRPRMVRRRPMVRHSPRHRPQP